MQQLERERTTLERRKSAIEAASSLSIRAAEQRQSDAERQERELRDQLAVVMRRLEIARNRADDARQFLAEQLIAEPQLNERLEAAASLEQSVLQNKAQVNEAVAAQSRAELEKRQVGANLDRDIAEIDQRLEQINAQIQRTGANTAHVIRAPIDGKITGLQARAGEHASSDIPLGIVLPEDSFLIAEVYLPSRAIGFVETGQTVKLQYDAFPYQKFGVALGEVSSIANTSLLPQELSVTSQTGEPVYRVSIAISDQNIKVFSRNVPLHAGMEFTAVVVLENRRLLEWLLEPLARK